MESPEEIRPVEWPSEEPEIPPSPRAPFPLRRTKPPRSGNDDAWVLRRSAETASVLRMLLCTRRHIDGLPARLSAREAAAAFSIGLDEACAGSVLAHLGDEEIGLLVRTAAALDEIPRRTIRKISATVRRLAESGEYTEKGGPEAARRLSEASGRTRPGETLSETPETSPETPGHLLEEVGPERMVSILREEHPQTIALALSMVRPAQAAEVLLRLSDGLQADVIHRIATMKRVSSRALDLLGRWIQDSLRNDPKGGCGVGGSALAAEILGLGGAALERNALEYMSAKDAKTAESVRERLARL